MIVWILVAIFKPVNTDAPRYFHLHLHSALKDFDGVAAAITEFRRERNAWPARNADIGLPQEGLKLWDGLHVYNVQDDGGVLLQVFAVCRRHEAHCRQDERYEAGWVSFRPAVNERGEIVFVCGHEAAPGGYRVVGANRSSLSGSELPKRCRKRWPLPDFMRL